MERIISAEEQIYFMEVLEGKMKLEKRNCFKFIGEFLVCVGKFYYITTHVDCFHDLP
jgi:hypothetical protein